MAATQKVSNYNGVISENEEVCMEMHLDSRSVDVKELLVIFGQMLNIHINLFSSIPSSRLMVIYSSDLLSC